MNVRAQTLMSQQWLMSLRRHVRAVSAGLSLLIWLGLGASRLSAQFSYTEDFTGSTSQGWSLVTGSSGQGNSAYLTANTSAVGNTNPDPVGQGWLRLTDSGHNQANAAWFDCPLPASSGSTIQVSFTMAMYNAKGIGGGDGIGFFLWDAQSTFNAGAYGGSLAYAPKTSIAGLSEGYVGVGFDVYGNYSNPTEGRTGGPGFTPEAVAIRGGPTSSNSSGVAYTNYDYLNGSTTPYKLDFASLTTRPDQSTQYRNVRVTISPIYDTNGKVIASSVVVEMQFGENGLWQTITTATLYGTRPDELRMGFGGSTGDAQETYEINNLGVSVSASADSNIWDNSSGNSIWDNSNPTNWNVNTTPTDHANVIFNDSYVNSNQNITLIGTRTISGAWFGGTYSYAINSGTAALLIFDTGTSTQSSTIALLNSDTGNTSHQINVPIEMHNDLTIYNYAGQTLTLGGAIGSTTTSLSLGAYNLYNQGNGTTVITSTVSGTGGLFENGASGRLILAGSNTYTGLTTVSAGALIAANSNALGSTSSGTVVYSGGTLGFSNSGTISNESLTVYTGSGDSSQGQLHNIAGTNTYASSVALTNSSTVAAAVTMAADSGSTLNITGVISGNTLSGLNKIGDGTLILSGVNTYAGATTISGGILQISADSGLGNAPGTATPGDLTFNGGTLAVTANTVLNSNRGIFLDTMSGTIQVSGTTTTTYAGTVAGTGNLTKTGDGTLLLNSANTYTGDTNINNGTLIINSGSSISDTGKVNIANTAGATLVLSSSETIGSLSGGGTTGGAVNLNNNTLTIGGNNTSSTFGGVISGSGGVTKNGTGTLTLTGNETYTGATTVNSGTLALGGNNVLSSSTSVILNGGTLSTGGYTDSVGTLTLGGNATLDLGGSTSQFTFNAATPSSTSSILLITDWTGSLGGGSGTQLFLTSTDTASLSILSQIQFQGYGVGATRLSTGEVVPSVISNGYYWNSSQTNWATNYAWNNATGSQVLTGPNATDALAVFGKLNASGSNSTNIAKTATLSTNATVGYVSFNSTQAAESYTITGSGTLNFSVSGTNSAYINMTSTASNLINVPIALSSSLVISQNGATTSSLTLAGAITTNNKNITVDGVGNTIISGNISSSSTTLTKIGTGTLTLSGTNSYSGGTVINGGAVAVSSAANLGSAGNALTFSNGTLIANGTTSYSLSGVITLNSGGGTINVTTTAANLTSTGNIIGTGDITKTGIGTLILNGNNTYSGTTYINQGTLVASSTNAIGDSSAVIVANVTGATLALSSSETIGSLSGGGTTGGTVALNGFTLTTGGTNASTTYDGLITGASGNLIKTGTGTMVITNNSNSYTGTTTVSAGELIMVNSGALGTGTVNVTSGAMLTLSGSSPINAASTKTLYLNGTGINSQGALNNEAGNNTWAGAVALSSASTIGLNGGNLTVSGNVALAANALTVNGSYDGVLSGIVSGTGTLIKTGTGTLTLSGVNTYTGTTTVSNGILAITTNSALGSTAAGTTVTNGATLALSNNITVGTEALTILGSGYNSNGVIQSSGSNTITGAVAMSLEPQINVVNGTLSMTGILSGTSGMSKDGTGTLVLSGANTFNGAVSINEGILAVQNNAALGTTSISVRTTVQDGATLQIGTTSSALSIGESITVNGSGAGGIGGLYNSGGNNTVSGLITLASDTTVNIASGTSLSATNVINGSGNLTKTGSGTLLLSGTNTYTGNTNINQGTIVVSSDANLGTAPTSATTDDLTFNTGTLQTGSAFTLNSNRGVTLNSDGGTINLTATTAAITYGGIVAGSGNLTVTGSGTLVLSGNNTYTGTTSVNGATLVINSDSSLGTAPGSALSNSLTLNNATLATSNSFTLDPNRGIVLSGTSDTIAVNGTSTVTAGGVISGTAGLVKSGTGTLVLTTTNSYTGATTITGGGTLALGNDNVIANSSSIILNNSTLATNGYSDQVGTLTFTGTYSTLNMGGQTANSALTFSNVVAGTTTSASSLLTITDWTGNITGGSGSQVYSTTALTSGSTLLTSQIQFSGFGVGATQLASGEIVPYIAGTGSYWDYTGSGNWSSTTGNNWNPNGTPNGVGKLVVFGSTSSSGAINTNTGAKTVTISGSSYTVGYILFDSKLSTEDYTITSTGTSRRLILDVTSGSAIVNATTASDSTISARLTFNDDVILRNNGTGLLSISSTDLITNGHDITVDGTGNTAISTAISGTGTGITKANTGTLTLSGANTYTGGTTISGGVLAISADNNLGSTSGRVLTFDGGTLAVNTTSTLTLNGSVTLNSGGGTINVVNSTSTVSSAGVYSGTGNFTKTGSGTLIMTGANTYTGDTYISQGTLITSGGSSFSDTGNVIMGTGTSAKWVLSSSETIGSLSGGGGGTYGATIALNSNTLTVGGNNTSTTYAGSITGNGGLTKTGSGTLVLTGANTYTGSTTINQGTLMLAASNALSNSNIIMAGSTTLAINGTINNSTAPVGTLTLTGNSTLDMGAGVTSEIHFTNSAAIDWGSNILTITNYDSTDGIYFGTSAAGLSPTDIAEIRFLNPVGYSPGLYYAMILSDGRIVPIVPEPSTVIGGLLLLFWIIWKLRRRLSTTN